MNFIMTLSIAVLCSCPSPDGPLHNEPIERIVPCLSFYTAP